MNRKISLCLLSLIIFSGLLADILSFDKVIKNYRGLQDYDKSKFDQAEEKFEENALQHPDDAKLHYNLGNAKFKQGDLEAAENSWQMSLRDPDFQHRSQALQNLGSIKFDQKNYPEAIKYFRDALIEDPDNQSARHNYEVTSRLLQKQQNQEQQQQQNQDDNEQNEDQDKEKEQQSSDQSQQNEEQSEQKQNQQQQEQSEEQPEEQQPELTEREKQDREEAEKTLKALLQKEKEELEKEKEKLKKANPRTGKYW
jgi:tetratricopeptide (TPR) repeat protein